jgi:hypothetical protein
VFGIERMLGVVVGFSFSSPAFQVSLWASTVQVRNNHFWNGYDFFPKKRCKETPLDA